MAGFNAGISLRCVEPMLPKLADEFATSVSAAAVVITAFALAYAVAVLLQGPLGDRFGKLRVVTLGTALAGITSLACAFAWSLESLAVMRLATGIFASASVALGMAYIGDVVPPGERQATIAHFIAGSLLGQTLGPLVGGLFTDWVGWRVSFGVLGVIFVLVAAILALRTARAWPAVAPGRFRPLAVHRNLLRLAPGFFEENRPAEITSRITVDTTIIEQVVGTTVSVALRNLVMGVACAIILFILAPKLAGMILLGVPLVVLPIALLGRKVRSVSVRSQDRIADVGTVTGEVLGAMKIVQAFNQQDREAERFRSATETVFATAKKRIALRALMTFIVIALMFSSITMVIWQGAVDVAAGRMTGGTIAAFVLYGGLLAGAFGALSEVYGDLLRAAGASERLSELLHAEPEIRAPANPKPLPEPAKGRLEFRSVEFRYPTRPDVSALHDFSLKVKPNEKLAVVGPSGAGKSTIFQLAERFYDPQAGSILLDGVDVRDADPADVRQRIAMVPQETVIFAASARDNL
ncbi:MAG: MFS transporter, partial [Burkholderiales bacterium]